MLTARLVEESERRAAEANKLKEELLRARVAEKEAKEKLLDFLSRNTYTSPLTVGSVSVINNNNNNLLLFCMDLWTNNIIFSVNYRLMNLFLCSLCLDFIQDHP